MKRLIFISQIALTVISCVYNWQPVHAQNSLNKDLIEFSDLELSSKWKITIIDSTTIEYAFTDSLDLCYAQDLSPVKNHCKDTLTIDTFKLTLRFEENWTTKKIQEIREKNHQKEAIVRKRILAYGDSLDWKLPKVNRQSVKYLPLQYVRLVDNWTEEELALISSIETLPNGVHKGYGVFVEINADYVNPRRKLIEIEQIFIILESKGLDFFQKFMISGFVKDF